MEKRQHFCKCGVEFYTIEESFDGPVETNAFLGLDGCYYCEDCLDIANEEYSSEIDEIDDFNLEDLILNELALDEHIREAI